jgi:hypothetical protein
MLLRLHQKIAPEWASNLVGLFETLSFARGSLVTTFSMLGTVNQEAFDQSEHAFLTY